MKKNIVEWIVIDYKLRFECLPKRNFFFRLNLENNEISPQEIKCICSPSISS